MSNQTSVVTGYNISVDEVGHGNVTFVLDGTLTSVNSSHEHFTRIVHALTHGEDVAEFLTPAKAILGVDPRLTTDNVDVFWNDEVVDTTLTRTIMRYHAEGRDASALVRFLERLQQNPSKRSREALWDWLSRCDLTVDAEGFFYGFKKVNEEHRSFNAGRAWVDGVEHSGHIPNEVGAIVSMPREWVDDNSGVECSHGLHVGTYQYAKGFYSGQGCLMEVRVDPADVVSVPQSDHSKMRVCRYEVVAIHDPERLGSLGHYEPEASLEAPGAWDEEQGRLEAEEALGQRQVPKGWLRRLFGRGE